MTTLTQPRKRPLENTMAKGENAGNQHFFPLFSLDLLLFQTGIAKLSHNEIVARNCFKSGQG